jgi:NTE family protein
LQLYSAGYSSGDIKRLVTENDLTQLFTQILEKDYQPLIEPFDDSRFNILSVAVNEKNVGETSGVISDKKILAFFNQILSRIPEDISFDDLTIPYRAVATDATSGDYVLFEGGSLVDAMRSSMSIPLVFDAYEVEGLYLLDGGLVDNMPIAYAKSLGYDIVIGVDMNASLQFNADDMHTITGAANATFNLIVVNTIKNQYSSANIVLTPDVDDIAVLDFSDTENIYQRGVDEVEEHMEELKEIAAMFDAEDLNVQDPDRIGPYYSLPEKEVETSSEEGANLTIKWSDLRLNEEKTNALSSSRLLLGVSGESELYTNITNESPVLLQFLPEMRSSFFLKNLNGTDWDLSLCAYFGDNFSIGTDFFYPLTGEDSKFYFKPSISFSLGAVSILSDRANPTPVNTMDFQTDLQLALKYTDGKCYNLNAGLDSKFYVLGVALDGSKPSLTALPSIFFNGVWYGNYKQGLFSTSGLRVDFTSSLGFYNNAMTYVLGASYKQQFALTDTFSLSFDASAYTSREPMEYMASYKKFGGWDGIPGVSNSLYARDVIALGASVQYGLGGFLPAFLIGQIRAGWRSGNDAFYLASRGVAPDNTCTAPFSELATFDIGFGFGYGVQTPICDLLLGVGISIKGEFAVYFKCY